MYIGQRHTACIAFNEFALCAVLALPSGRPLPCVLLRWRSARSTSERIRSASFQRSFSRCSCIIYTFVPRSASSVLLGTNSPAHPLLLIHLHAAVELCATLGSSSAKLIATARAGVLRHSRCGVSLARTWMMRTPCLHSESIRVCVLYGDLFPRNRLLLTAVHALPALAVTIRPDQTCSAACSRR